MEDEFHYVRPLPSDADNDVSSIVYATKILSDVTIQYDSGVLDYVEEKYLSEVKTHVKAVLRVCDEWDVYSKKKFKKKIQEDKERRREHDEELKRLMADQEKQRSESDNERR